MLQLYGKLNFGTWLTYARFNSWLIHITERFSIKGHNIIRYFWKNLTAALVWGSILLWSFCTGYVCLHPNSRTSLSATSSHRGVDSFIVTTKHSTNTSNSYNHCFYRNCCTPKQKQHRILNQKNSTTKELHNDLNSENWFVILGRKNKQISFETSTDVRAHKSQQHDRQPCS